MVKNISLTSRVDIALLATSTSLETHQKFYASNKHINHLKQALSDEKGKTHSVFSLIPSRCSAKDIHI